MTRLFSIGLAGAAGALLRYGLGVLVGPRGFPWITLAVNVGGCFALAVLLTGPWTARLPQTAVAAIAIGLLGAFTTFSTFGYETIALVRDGRAGTAISYAGLSVALGLAASGLGLAVGRAAGG